jgi:Ino eighty subunit 2
MDTINKLLKKQAPKTNARRKDLAGPSASDNVDGEPAKPEPIFVRWVSNKDGNQINIPEEMIDSPVGVMFKPGGLETGKMVEEVQ